MSEERLPRNDNANRALCARCGWRPRAVSLTADEAHFSRSYCAECWAVRQIHKAAGKDGDWRRLSVHELREQEIVVAQINALRARQGEGPV